MFEAAADNRTDEHEYESASKRMQEAVKGMLGRLDERERKIIISRFGLGGASEQTLEQLGRELGITKERVRQIESRAQEKLRKIASEGMLDRPLSRSLPPSVGADDPPIALLKGHDHGH